MFWWFYWVLSLFYPSGPALIIFVLFSSYHFGEEHWEDRLSISVANFTFYTLYGAFIFFLMFTLQYESVVEVIRKISGHHCLSIFLYIDYFGWCIIDKHVIKVFYTTPPY